MIKRDHKHPIRRSLCRNFAAFAAGSVLLFAGLIPKNVMAEPIGFMERYALAADREAVLAELIPGSDDYYFYHCLHYQNQQQLAQAEAILKSWVNARNGGMTPLMHTMTERQRLLSYDLNPQTAIDYLIRHLGIELSHSPPVRQGERRYPSVLPEQLLDAESIVRRSLSENIKLSPQGRQIAADWFLSDTPGNLGIGLHDFLNQVDGPYLNALDRLVVKELNSRTQRDRKFGDLRAHTFLTLAELDEVGRQVPSIADDNAFVNAKLHRLRPGADVDLSQQPEQRREYLRRVELYTQSLPPSYNSLKASAAYRLMEANLQAGHWDKDLFIRYLRLPRQSHIVAPILARAGNRANLGQNYSDVAFLPPVGNDQPLIETYLEHFLRDAKDFEEYTDLLQPDFVRRVFARTKLLAGVSNPQPFFEMLSAAERKELRDKVELTFAPQNRTRFSGDDSTELLVDVKNIDKLVVRVYEINSLAYYRTNTHILDTSIDLDGLVPTYERTLEYDRPAIERHRETIAIDETKGRGVWIIDLVGKGRRARTIIRHGDLHTVRSQTPNGTQITVLDEGRNVVPSAKLFFQNQEFTADDHGHILIPLVSDAKQARGIIFDGAIAREVKLNPLVEKYSLKAGFLIDPVLVQSGRMATLVVRPRLSLGSVAIDPSILKSLSLRVAAIDLDGIETTKQFENIELDQAKETTVEFRVPPRLASLQFELSGEIPGLSDHRTRKLSVGETIELAGIRKTNQTVDAFLTRDDENYVIETRGRNGEIVGGAMVKVTCSMTLGDFSPEVTLQSDDRGRVRLGTLDNVGVLSYGIAGQPPHHFTNRIDHQRWPSVIHLSTDETLQLPLVDGSGRENYRLLEIRDAAFQTDVSETLRVEAGFLVAGKLPAGDYVIYDRLKHQRTEISVVEGKVIGDVIAGKVRHRQKSPRVPLSIESVVQNDDGSIRLRLSGETRLARVHLVASRYFGQTSAFDALKLDMPSLDGRRLSLMRSGYISDLRLGDEYEYVLRRQFAAKYPGVMLPQPSVLLNPWETETTSNQSQVAGAGDEMSPMAASEPASAPRMRAGGQRGGAVAAVGSDYDFLSDAGVLVANLIPGEDGSLTIPADVVQGMPIVQLIVSDPMTLVGRTLTNTLDDFETDDLRLANSLPVDRALSFERVVSIVGPDQPLDLASLGSAQVQVYGDVDSLFRLYETLINDDRLSEFAVLRRWHTLSDEEKFAEYSKLASHELHLFLSVHDHDFFEAVIRPYLSNKKEKQFIDHWLLGNDVSAYAELWRYRRLSAAERALLAIRLPELRSGIVRDLSDMVDAASTDYRRRRILIETALRSSGLSRFDAVAEAKVSSQLYSMGDVAESEALMGMAGGMGGGGFFGDSSRSERRSRSAVELHARQSDGLALGRSNLSMLKARKDVAARMLYQELDSTKQWAESHFDRVRSVGSEPGQLIPVDAFWSDLAGQKFGPGNRLPVSTNLLEPTGNRHAALIALAMSGLPLQSGDISLPTKPETVYRPEHAVALVAKRLRELKSADDSASVLIGQLFQLATPDSSRDTTEAVNERFLTGRAYKGQVVVSNPTADEQTVEVFWQIPAGSLPLANSQTTDSQTLVIKPFGVSSVEYQFYFPVAGTFAHYPANVSRGDQRLASAETLTFRVADQWDNDEVTWQSIAVDGTAEQIGEFLDQANVHELDWTLIFHRLRDREVFDVVTETIAKTRLPLAEVWAYGFHHRNEPAMQRFLSLRTDLVDRVGPELRSTLLVVDAIDRQSYEHLEYAPLVRARIHRLGDQDEILNSTFLSQYQRFVRRIGFQPAIESEQVLPLTYYLLLQNRIEEAIAYFQGLDRDTIATQLQYDYLAGYLAMHQGNYQHALEIATRHAEHPVPRWRDRFGQMSLQVLQQSDLMDNQQLVKSETGNGVDEEAVSPEAADLAIADRERRNSQASASVPEVIVSVDGDQVRLNHRNADQVELNYYGVDLELLFSKAPFARSDLQKIAMVKPTSSQTVTLRSQTGTTELEIPRQLRSKTLLVESHVGASRSTALYYGGQLTTYVSEAFGQLQTTDATTHRPVAGAYVKVYARYPGGDIRFFKDGYTDGRGRFDFTSISASDAKGAERYAIMVLSETKGATLHEVAAP